MELTPRINKLYTLSCANKLLSEDIKISCNQQTIFECGGKQTTVAANSIAATAGTFMDDAVEIFLPNTGQTAKIILLAGQSNAEGQALKSDLPTSVQNSLSAGINTVKMLTHTRGAFETRIILVDGEAPTGFGYGTKGSGQDTFGPELGLAEYVSKKYPDETFYIVKYAIGGSTMATDWWTSEQPGRYLRALAQKTDNAIQYLQNKGLKPQIVAMCWMQGEGDSGNSEYLSQYDQNTRGLIGYIRTHYAKYSPKEGIAWIDAGISNATTYTGEFYWPNYEIINNIKHTVAGELPRAWYIDTIIEGLVTSPDNRAHYDGDSMLYLGHLFGQRIAYALENCTDRYSPFRAAPVDRQYVRITPKDLYEISQLPNKLDANRYVGKGTDYISYQNIGQSSYSIVIPIAGFTPGNKLLDITYRSTKDFQTTWYPHPYREQRAGGEMFPAINLERLVLKNSNDTWVIKTIDLTQSYYYPEYGYYLGNLEFTIDNASFGDIFQIKEITLHG